MYNDLIPMAYQNELMAIGELASQAAWRIGDIGLEIEQGHPEVEKGVIYRAVGSFAGKAARTVREYVSIARFYPQAIRSEYEILSFDHFRVAIRLGERWQEALEWAVGQVDRMNRPGTVDAMEAQFNGSANDDNLQEVLDGEDVSMLITVLSRLRDLVRTRYPRFTERIERLIAEIREEAQGAMLNVR